MCVCFCGWYEIAGYEARWCPIVSTMDNAEVIVYMYMCTFNLPDIPKRLVIVKHTGGFQAGCLWVSGTFR